MFLPAFTLQLDFSKSIGKPKFYQGVFKTGNPGPSISQQGFDDIIEICSHGNRHSIILGSPIVDNKVDRKKSAKLLLEAENIEHFAQNLNGEFLAVRWNESARKIEVITDRFSSYPIFWAQRKNKLCLSYNYMDIAKHVSAWPGFKLRPEKAYEFFILQRLIGEDTHDTITQSLPPATIMAVKKDEKPQLQRYWHPDYNKDYVSSEKQLVNEFDVLFKNAVRVRLGNDKQKTGIFLSGGHDSRLVAAYANIKTTCYTLSFSDNLEVDVARDISNICGHDHVYSALNENFFEDMLHITAPLSAGLYTADHALFIASGMTPAPTADIFLHGHGLDFMFQGMYLHAKYYQLFGRNTTIKHFLPVPADLPNHFIHSIPFRLKFDLAPYIAHRDFDESVRIAIDNVYTYAKTLSDEPLDHLEYMIFHNPSRHYTFSNVLSKRMCGEVRTPSFDNDLYRFYQSLPFKYRLHANMMRGAMYKINPRIANLKAANHALPAGWGPYSKTALLLARKIARHATFNQFFRGPWSNDRTWPDRDDYFREHESYRVASFAPLEDPGFKDFLSFIDWDKLKRDQKILEQQKLYGAFLVTLLSYYRFYKELER